MNQLSFLPDTDPAVECELALVDLSRAIASVESISSQFVAADRVELGTLAERVARLQREIEGGL